MSGPHGTKREDPDDPASEDTEEGEEDVLSQIKRTLDIGDYVTDNRGPDAPKGGERKAREEEEEEEGRHGEVLGEEEKAATSRSLPPVAG